jgi:hypothetical protein
MKHLRKFMRLPAAERRLLVKAIMLLCAVRVGLALLPFRTSRRLLATLALLPVGLRGVEDRCSADKVVRSVEVAGRLMPRASTCLTQALTAQVLLLRRGNPALVHIGTVKGGRGELKAHAWLESGGEVVMGGGELEQFTPLVVLNGGRQ